MKKFILYSLLIAATALAIFLAENTVLSLDIKFLKYTWSLPIWIVLASLIGSFITLHYLINFSNWLEKKPLQQKAQARQLQHATEQLNSGLNQINNGYYKAGISALEQALKLNSPHTSLIYAELAGAYANLADVKNSARYLALLRQVQPQLADIYQAETLYQAGKTQLAIDTLEQVLIQENSNPKVLMLLINWYEATKSYAAAEKLSQILQTNKSVRKLQAELSHAILDKLAALSLCQEIKQLQTEADYKKLWRTAKHLAVQAENYQPMFFLVERILNLPSSQQAHTQLAGWMAEILNLHLAKLKQDLYDLKNQSSTELANNQSLQLSKTLLTSYSELSLKHPKPQLDLINQFLALQLEPAYFLFLAGKISAQYNLISQAQGYLKASLQLHADPAVFLFLTKIIYQHSHDANNNQQLVLENLDCFQTNKNPELELNPANHQLPA